MKIVYLGFVLGLLLMLNACEGLFNKPGEVASADITDAVFLGIDKSDDFSPSDESGNNFVKLRSGDLDSKAVSVDFLDASGEKLENGFSYVYTSEIVRISERYSVIWGEFEFNLKGGETHSNGLLLDKQTGALFDLVYHYMPSERNTYMGSKFHQQDRDANIYFFGDGIKRLLMQDADNIGVEDYMDYWDEEFEEDFFVDPDGNIFFNRGKQLKLASGGIVETGTEMICFSGFKDQVFGFQTGAYEELNLFKLDIQENSLAREIVMESNILFESFHERLLYYSDDTQSRHFFMSPLLFIKSGESYDHLPTGIVFDEADSSLYHIILPEIFLESEVLGLEDEYLWIQRGGEPGDLFAFNLSAYTLNEKTHSLFLNDYTEFQLPEGMEIQELRFNEARIIEFRAYDLAEENGIFGFISMANGLECFVEDADRGPVWLTRIR